MTDIKYMDISAFRELGYLQEVNRLFLHPRGLALEVNTGFKTDDELDEWLRSRGVQFGRDARDSIWTFIRLMGMREEFISGVWDYRDDPEGMCFGEIDPAKVVEPDMEFRRHIQARSLLFGDPIQTEDHKP